MWILIYIHIYVARWGLEHVFSLGIPLAETPGSNLGGFETLHLEGRGRLGVSQDQFQHCNVKLKKGNDESKRIPRNVN